MTTTIFHVASGESDSDKVDIPLVEMKGQNLYQAFGSGTTYFRRYALSSQLGIISDKDVDAYGEQVEPTAKKELNLGIPKKTRTKKPKPPTGDPLVDMPMIQKLIKAKKTWVQIVDWLRLTYDDLTVEQLKTKIDEKEKVN